MIGKFFIGSFFKKKIFITFVVIYLYLIYQLFKYHDIQFIDYTIATTYTFCLSINQAFLCYIICRNKRINTNIQNILIRLGFDCFITKYIKLVIIETVIYILIVYIFPVVFFKDNILSWPIYIFYVFIQFVCFLLYEFIEIFVAFVRKKYMKNLIMFIPFILNIILQVYILCSLYISIGGLL